MRISDWSSDVCSSDLGDEGQYPAEDLVMYLVRQAAPRLRQPAMCRDLVAARQSQELPQRQRIRTAPDNPAFAVAALEIARSQERREGKGDASTCRCRQSTYH